jgi:hypothetical protein
VIAVSDNLIPPCRLPKRALGERWTLDINPRLLDCVVFLCEERKGQRVPGGTAFFIELDDDTGNPSMKWNYLVTALHELESIKGRTVYVRVNLLPDEQSKGFDDIPTSKDDWFKHDSADVAIIASPTDSRHAIQGVPTDLFIAKDYKLHTETFLGRGNPILEPALKSAFPDGIPVQIGHQVFFPGLFVQSAGEKKNLPIFRLGNIARMPGDELHILKYSDSSEKSIRGYLAESHSWGGHSGSPVFWHFEYNLSRLIETRIYVEPPQQPKSNLLIIPERKGIETQPLSVIQNRGWVQGLLGLVSAHYDIPTKAKAKNLVEEIVTQLNSGIAIVTPAEHITELLMYDYVVEDRKRRSAAAQKQKPRATADFASASKERKKTRDIDIPPISRKKFFEDLTKATQLKEKGR